jgi:hypothetical protein
MWAGITLSVFRCQVSGVRKIQRTGHRKQMTEDKGRTVSDFCPPISVLCYLTPETLINLIWNMKIGNLAGEKLCGMLL